jgi:hypothetical protein
MPSKNAYKNLTPTSAGARTPSCSCGVGGSGAPAELGVVLKTMTFGVSPVAISLFFRGLKPCEMSFEQLRTSSTETDPGNLLDDDTDKRVSTNGEPVARLRSTTMADSPKRVRCYRIHFKEDFVTLVLKGVGNFTG